MLSVRPFEDLPTGLCNICYGKQISFILYIFPHHLPVIVHQGLFLVHSRHNQLLDALVYLVIYYHWNPLSAQYFFEAIFIKIIQSLPVFLINFHLSHPHTMTKVMSELEICTLVFQKQMFADQILFKMVNVVVAMSIDILPKKMASSPFLHLWGNNMLFPRYGNYFMSGIHAYFQEVFALRRH